MTVALIGLVVSLVAATLAACAAWRRTPSTRVDLTAVVRAAVVLAAIGAVTLVGGLATGRLDLFGVIHVIYLFAVVAVPVTAGLLAARAMIDRDVTLTRPAAVLVGVGLLLAPLGWYMTHIEPYWLQVEHEAPVVTDAARADGPPIRIGVLTDFQARTVGEYERGAVDALLAESPDIILLPGDVFQDDEAAFRRELPALHEQFQRLRAPGGAFLVEGDTDPAAHLVELVAGTPVRFLDDEVVRTEVAGRPVTIAGIELDYSSAAARRTVAQLEAAPGEGDVRILLAHRPDAVFDLPPHARTDLVVTGHTHGGQVAVPGFGPLMTLSDVPRAVAAGGLFDLDGRRIYVGRGVGLERGQAPQMRLFVRPNIGVLTVT